VVGLISRGTGRRKILNENELKFIKDNVLPCERFYNDCIEFEKKDCSSILNQNIRIIFTSKNIKQYIMDENGKEIMSGWRWSH